jgi:lipopolysaccharide export system protein LptA
VTELPRRALGVACGAALWAALGAGEAAGQQGCEFIEGSGNLSTVDFGGNPVTYVSTPNLSCRDGVRIRADSAVAYQASSYVELIGRVRFEDAERRLTTTRAEYFTTVGRLQAHGSARVEQKTDGGVIRGDELIYLRAGRGRPRDQLDVFGGRPTARLFVRRQPAAGPPPTDVDPAPDSGSVPYDVDADRIVVDGDSYFRAMGEVEIRRETLQAFGDSVEYDQVAGTLRIADDARMIMDDRELTADVIEARLPGEVIRDVVARRRAVLTADEVRLEAPLVHVFFDAGAMQRLVATPVRVPAAEPGELPPPAPAPADTVRPVAHAQRVSIVADSLDVLTPAEAIERIHAAGAARAESTARDSLNTPDTPALARTDWMEGDTIVASFVRVDSSAAADPGAESADEYRLERLTATGSARSLYRLPAEDSTRACGDLPAIHYVTGERIVIEMKEGEIDRMDVTGQTDGVHAEPAACAPAEADSAAADSVTADSTALGEVGTRRGAEVQGAEPASRRAAVPPARPVVGLRRARRARRRT